MSYVHVDVETTSTHTSTGVILSIGAIEQETKKKFHIVIQNVDSPTLIWDDDTYEFWHDPEQKDALERLRSWPVVEPADAVVKFKDWVLQFPEPRTFCAWPASFDFPFIDELFCAYDEVNPFHYRTLDVKSYICGRLGIEIDAPRTAFPSWCEMKPKHPHDALDDAIAQMRVFEKIRSTL